jgi:hypothetical protein
MDDRDALLLAQTLVRADARGVHSHGVMRVPDYVGKLTRGGVNPRGRPKIVRQKGAGLVVDGDNAMGQIACEFAMREAELPVAVPGKKRLRLPSSQGWNRREVIDIVEKMNEFPMQKERMRNDFNNRGAVFRTSAT